MAGSCAHTELLLKPGSLVHEVHQARTHSSFYALSFFSVLLISTALVARVIALVLMTSAPPSGASKIQNLKDVQICSILVENLIIVYNILNSAFLIYITKEISMERLLTT